LLNIVIQTAFLYVKNNKNVSEYDVQQFILNKFKEFNLQTDKDLPIVAFRENTSVVHYYPKKNSKTLTKNSLILIDVWAKIKNSKAPFADITKMAYCGNISKEVQNNFNLVIKAREQVLSYINSQLRNKVIPSGRDISLVVSRFMESNGFHDKVNLYVGHCLGTFSSHGKYKNINKYNKNPLLKKLGYTLEPGIYIKNHFGIRSEIDFYIDENYSLILNNDRQNKIIKII
jgi:Xaa-Pro aminopeptidase